jgi:pimeloyl-ACP methyl ester carboxylesterase
VKDVELPQGTIRYRESGEGEPIVFLHGVLVNGLLWRNVVPELAGSFRCIVPDLPLGAHEPAMREDADLTPPGRAQLVADFLEALDLRDVTLVGNDTGGAIAQLVAADHPERLGRLILTNCDAYERFFPPLFKYLQLTARLPGGMALLAQSVGIRALQRTPIAFGMLMSQAVPRDVSDSWTRPIREDAAVRRDARKVLLGVDKRHTLAVAERLRGFHKPALLAWSPSDRVFPIEIAERLARDLPDARIEHVENSKVFVPEDQPQRLAALIRAFVTQGSRAEVNG